MKIAEVTQNFMKKIGIMRNDEHHHPMKQVNEANVLQEGEEYEYDMDAAIDQSDFEFEERMKDEQWKKEQEKLFEGLDGKDRGMLEKKIEASEWSKPHEENKVIDFWEKSTPDPLSEDIDPLVEDMSVEQYAKQIGKQFAEKRMEIANQFKEKLKIEKVADRVSEKIQEKDKLEKGRSIKLKLNEVKKDVKDRSRKSTQVKKQDKQRSKKSGLSLSM